MYALVPFGKSTISVMDSGECATTKAIWLFYVYSAVSTRMTCLVQMWRYWVRLLERQMCDGLRSVSNGLFHNVSSSSELQSLITLAVSVGVVASVALLRLMETRGRQWAAAVKQGVSGYLTQCVENPDC